MGAAYRHRPGFFSRQHSQPSQLPALAELAADARLALRSLRTARARLGATLACREPLNRAANLLCLDGNIRHAPNVEESLISAAGIPLADGYARRVATESASLRIPNVRL
jgi:hypothetical protein